MVSARRLLGSRSSIPPGAGILGVGVALTAIGSYAFLVLSARILGPTEYGALAVLWSMVYVASGAFSPLEQEVSRALAARRAAGLGGAPLVRRAAAIGMAAVLAVSLLVVAGGFVMRDGLLRGDGLLIVSLIVALFGHSSARLFGGTLSGTARFGQYGAYLSLDALLRLLLCLALIAVGITAAWPYGLAVAITPLVAIVPVRWQVGRLTGPGPEAPWRELTFALGSLFASSLLAILLLYAPSILIDVLSGPEGWTDAGAFNAALVLTRLPLVLFSALQIALLPHLSTMVAQARVAEIRGALAGPLSAIIAVLVIGCAAAFLVGPDMVAAVFGPGFWVDHEVIGLLSLGTALYIVSMTLAQGLIALDAVSRAAWSWGAGLAAMVAVVMVAGGDPLIRVGSAYAIGAGAAMAMMALLLEWSLRSRARVAEGASGTSRAM